MKLLMLSFGVMMAGFAVMQCAGQSHSFTVKDDIEMTRFSDPRPIPGVASSDVAQRSPDGKHFAVVTTNGILKSDRLESRILIFNAVDAKVALTLSTMRPMNPRVVADLVSFPHHLEVYAYASVITDLRWSSDSTSVYYRGEGLNGNYRLYRAEINSSTGTALTSADSSVTLYDAARDTIVYRAEDGTEARATPGEPINADALAVTGYQLKDILFSREMEEINTPKASRLYVIRKVKGMYTNTLVPSSSVREIARSSNPFVPFSLSPNGRNLIELAPVSRVPSSWESYEPGKSAEHLRYRSNDPRLTSDTNGNRPRRYMLVDLDTGKKRPLLEAPNGLTLGYPEENRVVWSSNGQRVLISNTFFSLDHISSAAYTERLKPCLIASVDVPTLQAQCLIFAKNDVYMGYMRLDKLFFGKSNDEVVLRADILSHQKLVQTFRYHDAEWNVVEGESQDELLEKTPAKNQGRPEELQLIVRQALNDPPSLWVRNNQTGQSRQLWDPNPQFAHVRFASVLLYHWRDKTGYEWTGGLVKPVDYIPGRRYPLVIQMYNFAGDQFMTDGMDPTAFAARHLASDGIVVLQIQRRLPHTMDDAEAQEHLEGLRSAIEHLTNDDLVDPDKVGVVGFSWTCWYVENALIKAPKLFVAATVADGIDHSYMEYHLFDVSSPVLQEQDDKIIGTKPFGAGLKRWVELAPGFHLDQVQTPLRIEAMTPLAILAEWEIYSSLQMDSKPVDLIYFPSGQHIHQKPLERLESQQGDVDWFRFWLQGYEDPDPAKRNEYRRWEQLREDKIDNRKPIS
jgi:hypothetical protein